METHLRTIIKSLTWRALALTITTTVAWQVTGHIKTAASIGVADTLIKLVVYYAHERIWIKVKLGRTKPPEYQI